MPRKFRIFSICSLSLFLLASSLRAATDLSFSLPLPAGGALVDSKDLRWGGRLVQTALYQVPQPRAEVIRYYRDFFQKEKFRQILEQKDNQGEIRLLRFQKEELVVSLTFEPKGGATQLIAAKFLQPAGAPAIDDARPSVKDTIAALPTQDLPGKDLQYIPRPPSSVRLVSQGTGNNFSLMYSTKLSVAEALNFYQAQMLAKGWQKTGSVAMRDALAAYKKNTGRNPPAVRSPFSGAEDMDQALAEGHVTGFSSFYGQAEITVFPNILDRKLGSIVQISYQKKP
jgi:hypothetical protein